MIGDLQNAKYLGSMLPFSVSVSQDLLGIIINITMP